jgi:UDP-glucose 4-epimerase
VREVLHTVERISGRRIAVSEAPRRAGDPPSLVARAERIRSVLGWQPRFDDLELIARTQYEWERALLQRPELQRN